MPSTKISNITLEFEQLELRTKHPFGISYGSSSVTKTVLVKLHYKDHIGLGEATPVTYHGETLATVHALLKEWQEADVLGDDPFAIEETMHRLDRFVAGNNAAKSAVELAMHDLCGKIVGQPTYKLLGLSGLNHPPTDFTIGIDSLEVIEQKTHEALADGFKILKVKQGTAQGLEYDKQIILRVRKVAPDAPLRVDANGGWTAKQAIEMSKFLAQQNVQFIEQPIPKYAHVSDWNLVRENCPLPIFADESISRAPDVARLAGTIDGVVVKLSKTGGLNEALKVIHTARAHSLQVMFGCMVSSSIAVSAAAQLQSLCDHLDLDGALLLANDPYSGVECDKDSKGMLKLQDLPGLGVVPR